MERELESVVGRPAVVNQKPSIFGSENHHGLFVPSARQNGVYGHLRTHRQVQPLKPSAHLPAGFVHAVHGSLPRGFHQLVIGRLSPTRHPRQCPVQPSATDLQPVSIGQDLSRVPQRQPHLLVQDRRQSQRLRSQLRIADSHRIRCLQAMASLHTPLTLAAAAHRDIESAYYGSPYNLFLILCLAAFLLDATAAMRTALWQWDGYPFIHSRRDGAARLSAIAPARLASWTLRVAFWRTARMRCRLALAGAQRRFQFLAQALHFLLEPFNLTSLLLNALLGPVQLFPRGEFEDLRLPLLLASAGCAHSPYRSRIRGFCPAKSFSALNSEASQAGKQIL